MRHFGLPKCFPLQLAQNDGYSRSLFERLVILGHPIRLLNVQYRMHPQISYFPCAYFYDRQVGNGENVGDQEHAYQTRFGTFAFVDFPDSKLEGTVDGFSKINCDEQIMW